MPKTGTKSSKVATAKVVKKPAAKKRTTKATKKPAVTVQTFDQ